MSSDNEEIPCVRKRVSRVWKYFEKLCKDRVRCRLCRHEQNYQGTTGNILRHLKNKHNVDATIRGQQENPQQIKKLQEQLEEVDCMDNITFEDSSDGTSNKKNVNFTKKRKKDSSDEEMDIDPYTESTIKLLKLAGNIDTNDSKIQKRSLEEERIMAEIDYFKEKAAFYRVQKNLAALQAKKVKYELDQMA